MLWGSRWFKLSFPLSQQSASHTCQVSGPGLTSATVDHPTHILVILTDSSGRPYDSLPLNVTAQLELASTEATPTNQPEATPTLTMWLWSKKQKTPPIITKEVQKVSLSVAMTSPSQYKVSYTPVSRGQHKLHVQINHIEINGSPFTVTVYPDPRQLGHPVRTVTGIDGPRGIAFNGYQDMIVSEWGQNKLSIFDIKGQKIRSFGSFGSGPSQMIYPKTIVTDNANNIYVSSDHKLQKFTNGGALIRCIGGLGSKKGEFDFPRGIKLHNKQIYVCDSKNHRIQVFDLDLNFSRSIDIQSTDTAYDIEFDGAGNVYVADNGNSRVLVTDGSGHAVRKFGGGKLRGPSGLLIADKYLYVSDSGSGCIVVYETSGQFVTSFGRFHSARCITSCSDGFIYVCDFTADKIQIF